MVNQKPSWTMQALGAAALNGYIAGISKTVKTTLYIESALEYTHAVLSVMFDQWLDTVAEANPHEFQHVYEWPTKYQKFKETVGQPEARLWRHTLSGRGRNKVASFQFLASKRPTPVDPILLEPGPSGKTVKEGVHIFVWKAPAMEYGMDITVTPKLSAYLAYVYGKKQQDDKQGWDFGRRGFRESKINPGTGVQFSDGPVEFEAGGGVTNLQFTSAFVGWWRAMADQTFEHGVRHRLENDLVDEALLNKAIRRGNLKSKQGSISAQANRYSADFADAVEMARADLAAKSGAYIEQARRRRMMKYGEEGEDEE